MKTILFSLLLVLSLGACTASLYPLVGEETVVYKKELNGKWLSDDMTIRIEQYLTSNLRSNYGEDSLLNPKTPDEKRLARYFAKSYLIAFEEKGIEYVYEGTITTIGGKLFAELTPDKINSDFDPFGNFQNGFSIARVYLEGNNLELSFIDGGKLRDLVLSGKMKISYEHEKIFDHFLITATTNELRSFLEKYGSDERLFNKKDRIILKRKE